MKEKNQQNKLLRLVAPRFPQVNVFSRIPIPPLGLLYVASAAEKNAGWRVEIIDENNYKGELDHKEIQKNNPADVVGFYAGMTSTVPRIFELAKLYKEMGVVTLAGGSHVDALPEEALENNIDIVVRGEGEESIVEILKNIDDREILKRIDGIALRDEDGKIIINKRREPIQNLDGLNPPNFKHLVNLKYPLKWYPVSRTRGCNHNCEFCTVRDQQGRARSVSPERTFSEIVNLVENYGARHFFITDDYFAQDRDGTIRLCNMIAEYSESKNVKLQFTIQLRAEAGRDSELIEAMWRAGVRIICIGLESPIPEDLKTMRKGQTVEGMERDLAILRKAGFYIHGMFIFGYPSEEGKRSSIPTREKSNIYLDFIRRTKIDTIQILKAVPIPGSKLRERLARAGRIYPLDKVGWEKYDGNYLCFEPETEDPVQVQVEATRIMDRFYRPGFLWHAIGLLPILPIDSMIHRIRLWRERSRAIVRSGREAAEYHISEGRRAASRKLEAGKQAVNRGIEAGRETASRFIETGREIASRHIEAGREAASRRIEAGKEAASRVLGQTIEIKVARISNLQRAFRNALYRYGGSRLLSTWHRIGRIEEFKKILRSM